MRVESNIVYSSVHYYLAIWSPRPDSSPHNYIYNSDSEVRTPVSSGVSLLHCTVQDEDVLVGCWNRRQQTHSLTGSSSKHWAKTDCLQRRLFNSAGKNYFPFIFSDWNSVDFCWWAVTLIYNCSKWGLVVTGCWLTGSLTAFNLLIISSVEPPLSLAVSVTLWPWHSTIKTELGES